MSWVLPIPLFVVAGVVAFVLILPRLNWPTSNPRLAAGAFATGVLTCLGMAAAWALWWWVEQR
jgi:hypothetical protein